MIPYAGAQIVEHQRVVVMLLRPGYQFNLYDTVEDLRRWEIEPGRHTYTPGGSLLNRAKTSQVEWLTDTWMEARSCAFLTEHGEPWLWYDFGQLIQAGTYGGYRPRLGWFRRYFWRAKPRPPYLPGPLDSKFTVFVPDQMVVLAWLP